LIQKTVGGKCFQKKTGRNLKKKTLNLYFMLNNVLANFTPEANFWDLNPQLAVPFKSLTKREDGSNAMWSISLLIHPESALANIPYDQKLKIIQEDYFPDFKPENYEEEILLYKEVVLTRTERMLVAWNKKVDERLAFIDSVPYNFDTFEAIDKMILTGTKLSKELRIIREELDKEKEQNTYAKGGGNLSLTDQGKI
jgi:hypothetical protein